MSARTQPEASDKSRLSRLFSRNSSLGKPKDGNRVELSSPKRENPGQSPSTIPPTAPSHNQKAEANGHDAGKLPNPRKNSSAPERPELEKEKEKGGNDTDSAVKAESKNVDESGGGGGGGDDEQEANGNASTAKSIDFDDEEGENSEKSKSAHRRSLWADALNSAEVGETRKARLMARWKDLEADDSGTDPKLLVGRVIDLTQDQLRVYTKRWGNKDEKTAAGTARSILISALKFKDSIDAVLKFDATGYGSSAWSVISFGLTV